MNPDNAKDLETMLPDYVKELNYLHSDSFTEFERKLDQATMKAMTALEGIIDDGILALDPEQLVRAIQVLTTSKKEIMDGKRKLLETVIKGQVMMKALEPKNDSGTSLLADYMEKQRTITDPGTSIFQRVNKDT